jgi:hypothetical protein
VTEKMAEPLVSSHSRTLTAKVGLGSGPGRSTCKRLGPLACDGGKTVLFGDLASCEPSAIMTDCIKPKPGSIPVTTGFQGLWAALPTIRR